MLGDSMMLGGGRKAAYSIEKSLLFRGAQKLARTFTTPTAQYIWTFRALVRRDVLGAASNGQVLFGTTSGGVTTAVIFTTSDQLGMNRSDVTVVASTAKFRDPNGWYDVLVSSDGATVKGYVNGVEVFSYAGTMTWINTALIHEVGERNWGGHYFTGYMAEVCFVDGQALPPQRFGETDPVTGSWRPKAVTGIAWGNNGFYLGKPWKSDSLGTDYSGRGNDWTPNGFSESDVVNDSPTNVYATLNPLLSNCGSTAYGNGNLTATYSGSGDGKSSMPLPQSGKFYAEVVVGTATSPSISAGIYIAPLTTTLAGVGLRAAGVYGLYATNPMTLYNNGSESADFGTAFAAGDVLRIAVDVDNGKCWVGRNSAWYDSGLGASGDPANGLNPTFTLSPAGLAIGGYLYNNPLTANFGQRPFAYTPPTGFKPLSTANMPATNGQTTGSFIGNGSANGPCIYTGAVPLTLSINGNAVVWGTHADKLATGFKIRTSSASYNVSGSNTWTATYDRKPTVGPKGRAPANAQAN